MTPLISAVTTKLAENKAEYTIAVLAALLALLFGVIWKVWLYGVLARTGAVVPRSVLGAIIGVLLITQLASLLLLRYLFQENAKLKPLVNLPDKVEALEKHNEELQNELNQDAGLQIDPDLFRALTQLTSLLDNLPKGSIQEKYVAEYHLIVTAIEREASEDLSQFRIPPGELRRRITSTGNSRRISSFRFSDVPLGTPTYSEHAYCDREVFLMRSQALLKFLTGIGLLC
jgi:hypothetical protein